jgi:GntR family transcriptional regulator/MocR family aminotransferase
MIMAMYLAVTSLVKPGDCVVTDSPGWFGASMNFAQAGAGICHVPVDEHGMDIDAVEEICLKQPVRMVYVTSHHQYPTTVALRPDRRIKLLRTIMITIFITSASRSFHFLVQIRPEWYFIAVHSPKRSHLRFGSVTWLDRKM